VAGEIATSLFNGQLNRAIQNKATKKAIRRAILIGWGGRDRTSEWRNQNPLTCARIRGSAVSYVRPNLVYARDLNFKNN